MNYDELFKYPTAQKLVTYGLFGWFLLGMVGVVGFAYNNVGFTMLAVVVWVTVWPLFFFWLGFTLWNRWSK